MYHASNCMFSSFLFLKKSDVQSKSLQSCQIHVSNRGEAPRSATEAAVGDDVS